MSSHPTKRFLALLVPAALLASLIAVTAAAPASAAKPKCQGTTATIVGTRKADIIRGTARRDVIVAKGGADRIYARGGNDLICAGTGNDRVFGGPGADTIWGQLGNDTLNGNAGNDFVAGQVGNDTINGGINYDTCYQGTGMGSVLNCELPAPPAAPAPVTPPPPPEPPTLVIAYSDVNTNHVYDAGDVMISKIVDTNGDGDISAGDTIKMGMYPTSPYVIKPAQLRSQFEDWRIKTHTVASLNAPPTATLVSVTSAPGVHHAWQTDKDFDQYTELTAAAKSQVLDRVTAGLTDSVETDPATPSQPTSTLSLLATSLGDDGFIDVEIYP